MRNVAAAVSVAAVAAGAAPSAFLLQPLLTIPAAAAAALGPLRKVAGEAAAAADQLERLTLNKPNIFAAAEIKTAAAVAAGVGSAAVGTALRCNHRTRMRSSNSSSSSSSSSGISSCQSDFVEPVSSGQTLNPKP